MASGVTDCVAHLFCKSNFCESLFILSCDTSGVSGTTAMGDDQAVQGTADDAILSKVYVVLCV